MSPPPSSLDGISQFSLSLSTYVIRGPRNVSMHDLLGARSLPEDLDSENMLTKMRNGGRISEHKSIENGYKLNKLPPEPKVN